MHAHTLLALLIAFSVQAQGSEESLVTLQSTVTGSQEQPRVMYIVPWQQPGAASFNYEMHNSIAEEVYAPIDRDEFVRGLVFKTDAKAETRARETSTNTETTTESSDAY